MSSLGVHRAWDKAKRVGIEAHFPGICRTCPLPINAGDLMLPAPTGGFIHFRCRPRAENRCDWGQCDRDPEAGAFCDYHAGEYEQMVRERGEEWWAD